jgi:transglutaminase-like putative cysteine protease
VKVEIRYTADYRYAKRVTFSPHIFRLIPKADLRLSIRRLVFKTNAHAVVNWSRDLFDNEVASVFYPKASSRLSARLRIRLDIQEKNAFGFLLDSHALQAPFRYHDAEKIALAPYFGTAPSPPLPFWQLPSSGQPTVEVLAGLNQALHRHIKYERREEGEPQSSQVTIASSRGSCRDFAGLLVEVLRGLGFATRYASGYLCEFGDSEKVAEGALHAWVEVYLPGAGWVGLDPTNGTFCDHHHITTAVGITMADVAPVAGTYFHDEDTPHEMNTSLQIVSRDGA